ncbi:MAG TPA: hypothetical protein VJ180_11815 [Pyrinomonadaceae bacterium]|nr:hypothetical protein [Pyrinomonadaceae bacterium]
MFTWVLSRGILAAAALLFIVSCSREARSKLELTSQDVSVIAERALHGVLPGMSPEEVRKRLQRYCLVQESTNPRGGDLLLIFENITPCEPGLTARLRALAQTTVSEACVQGTDVPPEQHRAPAPASRDGISIVFDHGVAVSATASCNLHPEAPSQTAQALLAQLLGRNLDLHWASDGQVGFLSNFAVVDGRKIYLRYTVFSNQTEGDKIFLTLSTQATF